MVTADGVNQTSVSGGQQDSALDVKGLEDRAVPDVVQNKEGPRRREEACIQQGKL